MKDLKGMTVEGLLNTFQRPVAVGVSTGNAVAAFNELARRLEEAEQKIVVQQAEILSTREQLADPYDAQIAVYGLGGDLHELAAHDAEVEAKVLEELSRFFAELRGKISTEALCLLLDEKAAEYRANGRKE